MRMLKLLTCSRSVYDKRYKGGSMDMCAWGMYSHICQIMYMKKMEMVVIPASTTVFLYTCIPYFIH